MGALVAAVIVVAVFERRGDRDLIERRLRACCEYRDRLGNLSRALDVYGEYRESAELLTQALTRLDATEPAS